VPEFFSEIEFLKIIYKEIIDGYSFIDKKKLYLKHLNDLENAELSRVRYNTFLKFREEGLPSEEERIKQLVGSEQWSDENEDRIISCRLQISDNEKNLSNISTNVIAQQREQLLNPIRKIIENTKTELRTLLLEKRILLGITANDVAEKETMYHFIEESFYEDKDLKVKYFKNGLDELESEEIDEFVQLLDENIRKFSEYNISKIAVLGFFLNGFSYTKDNISNFIRKPISQITAQQLMLFSLGNRNLNVLTQSDGEPPELIGETKIEDMVKWFDLEFSILNTKRKSGK
jgi:hypothetical protein